MLHKNMPGKYAYLHLFPFFTEHVSCLAEMHSSRQQNMFRSCLKCMAVRTGMLTARV